MGVVLNIQVAVEELKMVSPPFKCACRAPATLKVCSSGIDEGKPFYRCSVGYVENPAHLGNYLEDPTAPRVRINTSFDIFSHELTLLLSLTIPPFFVMHTQHLGCTTWVLAEVIYRFARDVYNANQLSDADLRATLMGITIPRLAGYNEVHGGSTSAEIQKDVNPESNDVPKQEVQ